MPSVWTDDAPQRELILRPPNCTHEEVREEYGFNEVKDILAVDRDMDLACRILTWLLCDIYYYDRNFVVEDSIKLVHLIRDLHRSPISASMEEVKMKLRKPSESFKGSYDNLNKTITKLEKFPGIDTTHFKDITSRTLLELMTRIIAQKSNSPLNIDQYNIKLHELRVSKELRKYETSRQSGSIHIGIPKLIFICIHTTDSGNDVTSSQHVIATSREHWPSFPKMRNMAWSSRRNRLQDAKNIERRTMSLWETIEQKHNDVVEEQRRSTKEPAKLGWRAFTKKRKSAPSRSTTDPKTQLMIIQARKAAVAEYQNLEKLSHCNRDEAAAFPFPDCNISGRCFKCQSLYPYTMHAQAKTHESDDACFRLPLNQKKGQWQYEGYPDGACAEDLAHQFCEAVNVKYRSSQRGDDCGDEIKRETKEEGAR